jgi:hypothetical protein
MTRVPIATFTVAAYVAEVPVAVALSIVVVITPVVVPFVPRPKGSG